MLCHVADGDDTTNRSISLASSAAVLLKPYLSHIHAHPFTLQLLPLLLLLLLMLPSLPQCIEFHISYNSLMRALWILKKAYVRLCACVNVECEVFLLWHSLFVRAIARSQTHIQRTHIWAHAHTAKYIDAIVSLRPPWISVRKFVCRNRRS